MEAIEVVNKNNGYLVRLDYDTHKEYVFKSTELLNMLEFIGNHAYGIKNKVKVTEK